MATDNSNSQPARQHSADGRVARGERTRDAIVAAHTALLREGVLKPTGKRIAERAGVSLRTLWLNFGDLEGLLGATTDYWLAADEELRRPVDPALPLAERIELFCAQRTRRLENIAPAARSAVLGEPFSRALAESRRLHVARVERDVTVTFAAELDAAGDHRAVLTKSLFIASSWPAWLSLRDDWGLDAAASTAIMRYTISTLLGV